MSKQGMWSINDNTKKSRQMAQSNQPSWMAHWMKTSSNATADRRDENARANDHITMEASRSVKDLAKMEASSESLRMSSKSLGNKGVFTAKNENSSREYTSSMEGISRKPLELVKTHFSAKDRSSSTSMHSQERFATPSTHIVPYHALERSRFDKGKALATSSIFFNNQESEMDNNHNHSDPPSKSSQDWFQKTQKCSRVMSLLANQSSEKSGKRESRYEHFPPRFPGSVHETMRICTTVDSLEATPRGSPWFSQTTRSLLITKKSDGNVSKETDIFRRLITQLDGNSSSDLEYVPPCFGQANRGVKLQTVSSSNSEGALKFAAKNESSTETDTMEMDFSKEERLNFGSNSTRSTKVFNFDSSPSPRIDVASSREVAHRRMSSKLPDINLEPNSSEDIPTSSRTQSLEMDILLSQADPKSNLCLDNPPKPDPTAPWVKRLKLNPPDSSPRGTKVSRLAEIPSHDKNGDLLRTILKKGSDNKDEQRFPHERPRGSKEMLLSHVWIKRWLSNGLISQKEAESVVCEPQSLKSSLDELEKKQFPSIAAMAMMGKSMTGYQTCELQKRGSYTIWKTNAF